MDSKYMVKMMKQVLLTVDMMVLARAVEGPRIVNGVDSKHDGREGTCVAYLLLCPARGDVRKGRWKVLYWYWY